jgi:uncharacterized protein (TIGR03118 family)
MNYPRFPKPSIRTLAIVAAFLVVALLSAGAPKSSAAKATAPSPEDTLQNSPELTFSAIYEQTNLVSDLPGFALVEDPFLVNPWGVTLNASSPFWVVNNGDPDIVNGSAFATLYQGDVAGSPLVRNTNLGIVGITAPPSIQPLRPAPTAIVANTTNEFVVSLTPTSPAAPAHFIIASEIGAISAWQPFFGSQTSIVKVVSGHQHTGLAIGNNGSANLLYAADFTNGAIDVFDKDFNLTSVPGNFADATIPASYHPFNIQNLGGSLYVTYAQFNQVSHRPNNGQGMGFVRKFDTNGVRDNGFAINNGVLDGPWGIAIAPPASGPLSGFLIVGNFTTSAPPTQSSINVFNATTGALFGTLTEGGGASLRIDELRTLVFGNGVSGGDSRTIYFSAGAFSEHHGLFGSLKPVTGIPQSTIQFSGMNWNNTDYFVRENEGHIDITVTRTGVTGGTATVNYATVNGSASQCCNYEIALGKLTFGPGETSKTFRVLIVDNHAFAGGSSVLLNLVLSNATGAALVTPKNAQLLIFDDEYDTPGTPPNTSDDPALFVRQQYFDFLNREPDTAGFSFWTNQITSCGTDQQCIELKRINVSAAFFLSIEFQRTGMLAYLTEKAASGGLPRYGPFMRDVQALQKDFVFGAPGADAQLESNKQAFFDEFVTRPEFAARYSGLTNSQYVFALFGNAALATSTGELYIARLNGAQVVPPTGSPATGVVILRQAVSSNTISVSLSFNGLTSAETAAHIHGPADASNTGPVIVTLPNGQLFDFQSSLSNSQFLSLSDGKLYVDIHTANFPNSEIRAQFPANRLVTDMIIRSLDDGIITRAQALRLIAESDYFRTNELNRAFVLMEYFGYLRRNPNDPPDNNLDGYNFWLAKLNQFNGNFVNADMVKAFLKSTEYRGRFGPP